MDKSKANINEPQKKSQVIYEDEIFMREKPASEEIDSDGSASAFDETESVNEDNFDNLSEK